MALIEQQDISGFEAYLKETRNTICGRHPICVFLRTLKVAQSLPTGAAKCAFSIAFVRYAQSSACMTKADSSVSYASAVITQALGSEAVSNGNSKAS